MPPCLTPLPIDAHLPTVVQALRAHSSAVLVAPPGSGKTTRVPPALLDSGLVGAGRRILMLEPRRIAARAAARRIAEERGGTLGEEVGYQIRFEDVTSARTRLAILTEGLLTRRFLSDPYLDEVAVVVLDEFHERSIHADLALAFLVQLQQTVRDDLKILVMSATILAEPVARFLGNVPVITAEGRPYPVDVRWLPQEGNANLPARTASAIRHAMGTAQGDDGGDFLVFLPGAGAMHRTRGLLESSLGSSVDVHLLHGDLPSADQDRALLPGPRRKIVLATNIAQTSLTIEGVSTVVDSGLVKTLRFDVHTGTESLDEVKISRASATQRAGRAGRTRPGRAFRMWSRQEEAAFPEHDTAEIQRIDLSSCLLDVVGFARVHPKDFPWFETPPPMALDRAVDLLTDLGALSTSRDHLTGLGEILRQLPIPVRLGAFLVAAHSRGVAHEGALWAALASERDLKRRGFEGPPGRGPVTDSVRTDCDLAVLADQYRALASSGFSWPRAEALGLDAGAARAEERTHQRLVKLARHVLGREATGPGSQDRALRRALLAGFPDRVGARRAPGSPRLLMVGGRGAVLDPISGVHEGELIIAVDLEDQRGPAGASTESRVRRASRIEPTWLQEDRPDDVARIDEIRFDPGRGRVEAVGLLTYRDLAIGRKPLLDPPGGAVAAALAAAVLDDPARRLPLDDDARALLDRLAFLRSHQPAASWPDLEGQDRPGFVESLCHGSRSLSDLERVNVCARIRSWLGALGGRLDRLAPERIEVPSGSLVRLRYERDGPPVLSVRLQECFGLSTTPRVLDGQVGVRMELLGPNMRPVQITQDLASFWTNTYQDIRKDLRARYPKHSWPEDPTTAPPQRRPSRHRS